MTDDDLPVKSNGPAYTVQQAREGVPLSYVGNKLSHAIEELNRHARQHPEQGDGLLATMHHLLVAYLGLHNMLAKANDRTLSTRMLNATPEELVLWLKLVQREGDVQGLAGVAQPRTPS